MAWQVQDAKARFREFLDAALRDGPQVVIRRGVEAGSPSHAQATAASPWGPVRYSGS